MKTKNLTQLVGMGALALLTALPQAGCARRETEIEGQGADIEVERGPGGTQVEVEPESQAEQDLERAGDRLGAEGREAGRELGEAGRDLGAAARDAGREVGQQAREAGKELEEGARAVGDRLAPAAREAGRAVEEGARRVGEEVGPIAREVLSDATITARVKAKLIADPEIKSFHIDVDTVNGVVTLNGEVESAAPKAEAEKLARQTEGVKQVNNVIQVVGQPAPAPPSRP